MSVKSFFCAFALLFFPNKHLVDKDDLSWRGAERTVTPIT